MFKSVTVLRLLVLIASMSTLVACGGGGGGGTGPTTPPATLYDLNVTITGLTGPDTLTISNGSDLENFVSADNDVSRTLSTSLADGTDYTVAITSAQPTKQRCTVAAGVSSISTADANIIVNCEPTYVVNVTVNNLSETNSLLIKNGNDLITFAPITPVPTPNTRTKTITTDLVNNDGYVVTVGSTPTKQICSIEPNGSGTGSITNADANIIVNCVDTYDIKINVAGLINGTFLTVANGADTADFNADATNVPLSTGLLDGASYVITIKNQPAGQFCKVLSTTTAIAANDASINVGCQKTYTLSASVKSLNGSLTVTDKTNSATFTSDGTVPSITKPISFTYLSGTQFDVIISSPSIGQTCSVAPATTPTGTFGAANEDIVITCVNNPYTVSVNVKGFTAANLAGNLSFNNTVNTSTNVPLTVLAANGDGVYPFTGDLFKDDTYAVSVTGTPQGLTCSVTSFFGTIVGSSVTLDVNCSTVTYPVNVNVTGLTGGSLKLLNNIDDSLSVTPITTNGAHQFTAQLVENSGYDVQVAPGGQPAGLFCSVLNGAGTIGANLDPAIGISINVSCAPAKTVSVNVVNFSGKLTVQNSFIDANNVTVTDNLPITASGKTTFTRPMIDGQIYNVSIVATSVKGQECTFDTPAAATGTITGASVNINLTCVTERSISVNIPNLFGPINSLTLLNNAGDPLIVQASGISTFSLPVLDGQIYNVTIGSQSGQECTITLATDTVTANVVVPVICKPLFTVSVAISGNTGPLTLQNVFVDSSAIKQTDSLDASAFNSTTAKPTLAFNLLVLDSTIFTVSVSSETGQVCSIANPTGTINADVTINITCLPLHTVSVNVTGFTKFTFNSIVSSLIVENIFTDPVRTSVVDSLTYSDALTPVKTFTLPVLDGETYTVSIATEIGHVCTVTSNSTGIIKNNVTANIRCKADQDSDGFLDINDFFPKNPNKHAKVNLNLSTLHGGIDGSNGFVINGIDANDFSGVSVSNAGDINNDGFDDILVSASNAKGNDQFGENRVNGVGESYIIFGNSTLNRADSFELSSLNGNNGFVIKGIDLDDRSGISVSGLGDINGDGFGDFIIGASFADTNSNLAGSTANDIKSIGQSYVVFGRNDWDVLATTISPLDGAGIATLELKNLGANGFIIDGAAEKDFSGGSVSDAGDVNGDGINDIIIGASGLSSSPGKAYVLFGRDTVNTAATWPTTMSLSTIAAGEGFVINGLLDGDKFGASVSSAGDVNGDKIGDIIIGAPSADPGGKLGAGETYIIFGSRTTWATATSFDLSTINGTNGFILEGVNAGDNSGSSVSGIGRFNNGTIDDFVIGAYRANVLANSFNVGESYVVFGQANWSARTSLSALTGSNGFTIRGLADGDSSGFSVSGAGDVNGDTFTDVIIGANQADVLANQNSGESYVIFGRDDSASTGTPFTKIFSLVDTNLNGDTGFTIKGIDAFDASGVAVSSAGDFNADGITDFIVGASDADAGGRFESGETYIVFGCNYTTLFCIK